MLYTIGTKAEISALQGRIPERVIGEVLRGVSILDAEYGEERNYFVDGGYSLIADTVEDVEQSLTHIGKTRPCEWVTKLGDSGWASALYLLNDDFSVVLYTPISVMPTHLLQELEEE